MLGWDDPDRRDAALQRMVERVHDTTFQPKPLSRQEWIVVFLISHGVTRDESAEWLHLSVHTIEEYAERAQAKLGASSRAHAVATALRLGLIS